MTLLKKISISILCFRALQLQLLNDMQTKQRCLATMRDDIDRAVRDIDTTFAEIVYYGFVAYFASTYERTFSSAVNHIRHVGVLSDQCANPFLRTVSSLFQHYTYRRLCCGTARVNVNRNVNFGTHDYMEKSLKQFELAADCVGREFANDEALRSYVHCWYLMNTVQSYLLITNEFEVDTDTVPGKMSMALVKNYLGIIETKLSGISIVYCVMRHKILKWFLPFRMNSYRAITTPGRHLNLDSSLIPISVKHVSASLCVNSVIMFYYFPSPTENYQ